MIWSSVWEPKRSKCKSLCELFWNVVVEDFGFEASQFHLGKLYSIFKFEFLGLTFDTVKALNIHQRELKDKFMLCYGVFSNSKHCSAKLKKKVYLVKRWSNPVGLL